MDETKVLTIIFLTQICVIQCARIIGIFGLPSLSHTLVGRVLLKELASRGHNVTMITHFPPDARQKNYDEIQVNLDNKIREEFYEIMFNGGDTFKGEIYGYMKLFHRINKRILDNNKFRSFISQTSSVDVFIIQTAVHEVFLGLAYKYNAPVVTLAHYGSTNIYSHMLGSPIPFSTVPDVFTSYSEDMSFIDRVVNAFQSTYMYYLGSTYNICEQEKLKRQYFPNSPPVQELMDNVTIHFLYSHFSTEILRPKIPGNIDVGGFHLYKKQVAIPSEIQNFLDNAHEGVILMSLGSHISDIGIKHSVSDDIFTVINNQTMKVLFKFERTPKNIGSHVMIRNWFPQFEILAHPNIKLFITHGGLNSFMEALFHGIPIVGIPFMLDQTQNIAPAIEKGFGVKIDVNNFTRESFSAAIKEVLENPAFKTNALKHKEIFLDREVNPLDLAVYWVEYAIKHKGAPHLKNKLKSIPMYQYLLLDVILFLCSVSILGIFCCWLLLIRVIKLIRHSTYLYKRKFKIL